MSGAEMEYGSGFPTFRPQTKTSSSFSELIEMFHPMTRLIATYKRRVARNRSIRAMSTKALSDIGLGRVYDVTFRVSE